MTTNTKQTRNPDTTRYLIVAALVALSFFGAYRYASASNAQGTANVAQAAGLGGVVPAVLGGAGAAGGAGGGCCGGGGGAEVKGAAKVEGGVQKISVDASQGYNPNTLELKAGVPAEITFSQSGGCTAVVQSSDLGFSEDLTSGPKTVKLDGLSAGTYNFACGMDMVRGTIVVQ